MNINLVIDQLMIEGMTLSRGERMALEETLRESLTQALNERAAAHSLPEGRRARREQMQVSLSGNMRGTGLAKSLGASLGSHVWDGQTPQSYGQGEKR
ncbi:hypothetical protein [Methylobacter marinus]|uniref:hypothetical protein n=1 Tax=Methylobacter marinus TaxID=34058 RepID=UPI0003601A1A|nr:hypothetical protein [Methylobacter marinus]